MKKVLVVLLFIIAIISLVACSNNETANFSETVIADTDEYKITITDTDFNEGATLEVRVDYMSGYNGYCYIKGAYINGIYCTPNWEEESCENYYILTVHLGDELVSNGIEKVTELEIEFEVYDFFEGCVVAEESVHIYPYGEENANDDTENSEEDDFVPISDDIESILDSWVYNGDISGYILGETRHLIYKNIEATFDDPAYQIFGVVDDSGNYIHEMQKAEDYGEIGMYYVSNDSHKYGEFGELLSNSTTCSFRCNDYTLHLGNNLFADLITDSGSFSMYTRVYNANDNSYFVIDCGMHNECWTAGNTAFTIGQKAFLDGFNDGGFIATNQHEYTERVYGGIDRVLMIYDTGDVLLTDIVRDFSIGAGKSASLLIGDYSDGLFWAYGNFYDANGNLVIDFSEKDYGVSNSIDDVPYFENGECRLNTSKSGEKWEIYIDKEGNILYNPVKISE